MGDKCDIVGRKGVQMGNLDKSNMVACKAFPSH